MAHSSDNYDVALTSAPPELIRTSVPLTLGLTVVTLGLYYPVWFLRQRVGINRLNPTIAIRRWPFAVLCVMHAAWVLLLISGSRVPDVDGVRVAWILLAAFAALWGFTVVQCLAIRRAIEHHAGVALSTMATVCQGALYLQYVINTALFIELSPEAIVAAERTERLQFEQSLAAATPHVFVTSVLIALNCVMFVVVAIATHSLSAPAPDVALRFGAEFAPLTTHGQWWRLLTSTFVHFGVMHILVNMLVFWRVGPTIERAYGNLGFAVLYALAGVGGAFASLYWQPEAVSAGASGAIFGLFGGLLAFVLSQHQTIPERTASSMTKNAGAFVVYNVLSGISANLVGGMATVRVDVAAHLGGLATGFVAGLALARPLDHSRRSNRWRRSALTAAVGVVAAAAVARSLPAVDDPVATLRRVDTLQRQLIGRYTTTLNQLREKKMSSEQFADVVENEFLPPWTDLRRELNGLRVVKSRDVLVSRTVDFMTLQADAWRLTAEGIRKNDVALVERGREDNLTAARVVSQMRGPDIFKEVSPALLVGLKSPAGRDVADANLSLVCNSYTGAASRSVTYAAGCRTARIGQTNRSGGFIFVGGLPSGLYTLSITADGYRDAQRDVEIQGSTQVSVTLVPLVDALLVAMQKLSDTERRTTASYNGAVNKLQTRIIAPEEFTRLVESDVVAEWTKFRDSIVMVDLTPPRQAAAATVREYASLRIEGFEAIARGVGTRNAKLMKQGAAIQTEASQLMKNLRIPN